MQLPISKSSKDVESDDAAEPRRQPPNSLNSRLLDPTAGVDAAEKTQICYPRTLTLAGHKTMFKNPVLTHHSLRHSLQDISLQRNISASCLTLPTFWNPVLDGVCTQGRIITTLLAKCHITGTRLG
jgi:hypothetical protein